MQHNDAYLVLDIGTGNVRVAVVAESGKILCVKRDNVHYETDPLYEEALHFDPDQLWNQIERLMIAATREAGPVTIRAVTAASQREGVVLTDDKGGSVLGMPNHDHRGRAWEDIIVDPHRVYRLTGRYPSSLFSALKVVALEKRRPELAARTACIMSISDWAQYRLTGVTGYEISQASETMLYDVSRGVWSEELCRIFAISMDKLPPLRLSGTVLGPVRESKAALWGLPPGTPVIVGGADTQLAIKSTGPSVGDIVLVSGTTTPVIKIVKDYVIDAKQRSWTNRHVEEGAFILETNCGVTGLNYQRLKEIFYPNEPYETIEREIDQTTRATCVASLGSLLAREKLPLTLGGFLFPVPVSHELVRADFSRAVLWDIACAIKENFDSLVELGGYDKDYVWACGGGFRSAHLRRFVADLTGRKLRIREGYQQASATGGAILCGDALGRKGTVADSFETVGAGETAGARTDYLRWRQAREELRGIGERKR